MAERFGTFERADRQAAFVCVLCLAWPDGRTEEFEGRVEGLIAPEPRGEHGFGYDPIFLYPPFGKTTGEMTLEEKSAVSHRARAFRDFARWLANSRHALDAAR